MMQSGNNTMPPDGRTNLAHNLSMMKTIELLQKAIAYGHVDKAKELVSDLAKQKALLSVTEQSEKPTAAFEEDIRVKVCIEDKDLSGSYIYMTLKPSMTIKHLKQKMHEQHNFSPKIQKWIVGKRLVKDEESLHKLRLKNDSSMFLYLLSPKSVGLSKAESTHPTGDAGYINMTGVQVPRQSSSGDSSMGLTPSPRVTRVNPMQHRAPDLATHTEEEDLYAIAMPHSMPGELAPPPPPPLREKPKPPSAAQVGWMCPVCTYMNEPTRPGCEMCSTDRPTEYNLPPEYELTEREKRRLEQERQAETLSQQSEVQVQAAQLDTSYGPGDFGLVEENPGEEEGVTSWPAQEGDRLTQTDLDASLAMALQKEEEAEFERRHRMLQRRRTSSDDDNNGDHGNGSTELEIESLQQQQLLEAQQNFSLLLQSLHQPLTTSEEEFDCPICYDTVEPGEGVILRECLHQFCRNCLSAQILVNENPQVKCPHQDENFSCPAFLTESEVKALVSEEVFEKYLQKSLVQAESQAENSYHCKTPDCTNWCVYDDNANFFFCQLCHKNNCLTCKAIHEGQNCQQYQNDLKIKAENDQAAKQTQKALQDMLKSGDAMECPKCRVVIQKKVGCDWLRCTMCKTEICWVTKGYRWGPKGTGDISGGCKCNVNKKKCHPNCQNCH